MTAHSYVHPLWLFWGCEQQQGEVGHWIRVHVEFGWREEEGMLVVSIKMNRGNWRLGSYKVGEYLAKMWEMRGMIQNSSKVGINSVSTMFQIHWDMKMEVFELDSKDKEIVTFRDLHYLIKPLLGLSHSWYLHVWNARSVRTMLNGCNRRMFAWIVGSSMLM